MTDPERLLSVEDAENWRAVMRATLEGEKEFSIVSSVEEAKAAIESGTAFTRIITDGLEGKWELVMTLAQTAGIPLKVLSGSMDVLKKAKSLGIEAVNKEDVTAGTVQIEDL